jgi:hypothetical protein
MNRLTKVVYLIIAFFMYLTISNICIANACVGDDCKVDSNVQDTNDGNKGYIFMYDCENGNNSLGQWVDPKNVPELKGEKGDKGDTGKQGIKGEKGNAGIDGQNGNNGEQGIQGEQGLQGIAGQAGEKGVDGLNGQNGDKGEQGKEGVKGDKGDTGKGLKDRVELIGEVRVFDTRKWSGFVYGGVDINNSNSIVGAKVQYKLGRSYEERRLDELEARINAISDTSIPDNAEMYTDGTKIGVHTKF